MLKLLKILPLAIFATLFLFSPAYGFERLFPEDDIPSDLNVRTAHNRHAHFLANYAITIYSTTYNNFPSDEANAVLQTSDGFMWFGGYNGLFRYDGAGFTVWNARTPGGFGSSSVRALYEDATGVLWIATNDRGIAAFENGEFTVYGREDGLPSNTVRAITSDTYGNIWGGTADGLFYINAAREITPVELATRTHPFRTHPFVTSLAIDYDNNIFAGLNSGELYIVRGTVPVTQRMDTLDGAVRALTLLSDGRVAAGTSEGIIAIITLEENGWSSQWTHTSLDVIEAIYEDSGGFIWLLARNGIAYLDERGWHHYIGNPNGAGFYTAMWEDYQNGFWFAATRGGIALLSPSAITRVDTIIGEDSGPTNAVVTWGNYYFIGSDTGLHIFDEDWNPAHVNFSALFDTRIRGLTVCTANYVWVATHDYYGIVRYNPANGTYFAWTVDDGLLSERTRFVHEISGGVMVVGTAVGVNFIRGDEFANAADVFGTTAISLPDMMVLSAAYTSNGTLILGTDGNGIYAISPQGTTRFTEADGLTGGVVLRVLYDQNLGGVWVAASPGLNFIDAEGIVHEITKVPPFAFLDIMHCGYNSDDLILMHSTAIIRTNAAALLDYARPFEYAPLYRATGHTPLVNANAWNLFTPDGRLFFNTDRGAKIYNPGTQLVDFTPFAGVSAIYIDGVPHGDFTNRITIPQDAYRLTAQLALLSFGLENDTVLRFKLYGQDTEATTLSRGDSMVISYTNLRGGAYTLRLWTENPEGVIGNEITIDFFKELAFFEHTIVWVALILLGIIMVVALSAAIIRLRTRALQARQQEYREIIIQSLTAIANAIDAKDEYTSGHSVRVANYSVGIARKMGMDSEFTENLYYIGLLHDVGKIGIANEIINKPGKLTDEEYNEMKTHPGIGYEILKGITAIPFLTAGAIEHHERWDGKGYQAGISGENISLQARIIAVADTYDAMSSDRSYRKALPQDVILAELKKCEGTQFDPQITPIAIELIESGELSKTLYS